MSKEDEFPTQPLANDMTYPHIDHSLDPTQMKQPPSTIENTNKKANKSKEALQDQSKKELKGLKHGGRVFYERYIRKDGSRLMACANERYDYEVKVSEKDGKITGYERYPGGSHTHTKDCDRRNNIFEPMRNNSGGVTCATVEVTKLVDELASADMTVGAKSIAKDVATRMNNKYPSGWNGLTTNQMEKRVYNHRRELKGGDIWRTLESDACRFTSDGHTFLQFNQAAVVGGKVHRMIGFGHPTLMKKMKGKKHFNVDATFKICPKPFKQCLIIMVWDPENEIYVPVMWILMMGQTEREYSMVFSFVRGIYAKHIDPCTVTCDFEQALINALNIHFRPLGKPLHIPGKVKSSTVGCWFHEKQARRVNMEKLGIPADQINFAMRRYVIDILGVVPKRDIKKREFLSSDQ